jgi:hypothetical protein
LTDVSGRAVSCADEVRQKRNVVLVAMPLDPSADDAPYIASVDAARDRFDATQTEVIATRDRIPGLPASAVLVADRWGELATVQHADTPSALPPVEQLLEWAAFVQHQCPECQGETR